jgi:hypothetical protein
MFFLNCRRDANSSYRLKTAIPRDRPSKRGNARSPPFRRNAQKMGIWRNGVDEGGLLGTLSTTLKTRQL